MKKNTVVKRKSAQVVKAKKKSALSLKKTPIVKPIINIKNSSKDYGDGHTSNTLKKVNKVHKVKKNRATFIVSKGNDAAKMYLNLFASYCKMCVQAIRNCHHAMNQTSTFCLNMCGTTHKQVSNFFAKIIR